MLRSSNMVSFDNEQLILVNERDDKIGSENKKTCHQNKGLLHRAFSIFVFNQNKQVLIHKRSHQKQLWPDFWTNSCCSHPRVGESLEQATQRRLHEELGIDCPLQFLYKFIYQANYQNIGTEHEMCHVYFGVTNQLIRPNPNEISAHQWLHFDELSASIQSYPDLFTPWLKLEWEQISHKYLAKISKSLECKRI